MSTWRIAFWAAAATTLGWLAPAHADECEAVAANLHAQIGKLTIEGRSSQDQSIVVALKHPDAEQLTLTCADANGSQPTEIMAQWNAAWPPSRFYDLVASAGAIIISNTEASVRSGAVLCAQRAMAADDKSSIYDVNGAHIQCTNTAGVGGATRIRISKLKETPPQ